MFLMVGFTDGLGLTLRLATSGLRFSIDKGNMNSSLPAARFGLGNCGKDDGAGGPEAHQSSLPISVGRRTSNATPLHAPGSGLASAWKAMLLVGIGLLLLQES